MKRLSSIVIKENPYLAKVVDPSNTAEYDACLRLRHDYFVKKRHWITSPHPDKEYDRYDPYCTHLAVFHTSTADTKDITPVILAYMRLLPWTRETNGFMLENEFACLLSDQDRQSIIRHNTVELSRLVIASQAPKNYKCDESHTLLTQSGNGVCASSAPMERSTSHDKADEAAVALAFAPHVLEVLLKLLYRVSLESSIYAYYAVSEAATLRVLRCQFGIPFQPLGGAGRYDAGTRTAAAFATLASIENSVSSRWPEKLEWYCSPP